MKGTWKDGQITNGTWTLTDGTRCVGGFRNQKPCGDGVWETAKGTVVEGAYVQQVVPIDDDKTVATTAGCPVTEYPDLTVSTCGAGYTKPQWMVSNLDADCVDNLVFGRGPVGMMCRNKNFNVGKGVIVVHGDNSDRRDMWTGNGGWGNLFLRRGYVVFSIDYTGADCEVDIAQASTFFQDAGS